MGVTLGPVLKQLQQLRAQVALERRRRLDRIGTGLEDLPAPHRRVGPAHGRGQHGGEPFHPGLRIAPARRRTGPGAAGSLQGFLHLPCQTLDVVHPRQHSIRFLLGMVAAR